MIWSSLGDTGIAAPLSEFTSVVLTDHGLVASHAAGKPLPPSLTARRQLGARL